MTGRGTNERKETQVMKPQPTPGASPPEPRPIDTPAEARQVIGQLSDVMDALLTTVEKETELVRAGHLREAGTLEPTKSDLARRYLAHTARLKASMPYLRQALPQVIAALRERHHTFQTLLQINLTVLATAQAVSEGIIRGLSQEVARKEAPQTYAASGQRSVPNRIYGQGLAVSRVL
jgi:hypothetical protein